MKETGQAGGGAKSVRFGWLDTARGIAVIAMTVFHFAWDLEYFGYAEAGLTSETFWRWFARSIAALFLFLAGFSFVLAHRDGLRQRAFLKRFGQILVAALLISISTYAATPERFVFFGILHQIAFASLIAVLVRPLPWLVLALMTVAIFALNSAWTSDFFTHPSLWWVGLAPSDPPTNDYVPMFPWTGWVIAGMACAKLFAYPFVFNNRTKGATVSAPLRGVQFLGQHSLIYYLVHQPVMIGLMSAFSWIVPPPAPDVSTNFHKACVAGCLPSRDEAYCTRFCDCVSVDLKAKSIFEQVATGQITVDDDRVNDAARMCTAKTDANSGD